MQFETCNPTFLHLYYTLSALFIKWFLLEHVKLLLDQLPKSFGWSDRHLTHIHTHTPICKILLNFQIEWQILAWLASSVASPHGLCQVVTGVSVAKYSLALLRREHLWHFQNMIVSLGCCHLSFCYHCVRVCVGVCVRTCDPIKTDHELPSS